MEEAYNSTVSCSGFNALGVLFPFILMVLATMNGFFRVNPLENTGASAINLPIYILKYF